MINQRKYEKRHTYNSMKNEGIWYSHLGLPQIIKTNTVNKKTSTGRDLTFCTETCPMIFKNTEQKTGNRQYPYSAHDNRDTIHSVETFDAGLGRKKYYSDGRTNYSRFFLWSPSRADEDLAGRLSSYRTDYLAIQVLHTDTWNHRRFPRNHLEKASAAPTVAQVDTRATPLHPQPQGPLAAPHWSTLGFLLTTGPTAKWAL
ncbi:testis-expressed protein 36 [Esox lucius]|uniref:testis-expressed protein 36 n=1 Tax=Esox lucius TaxID=8010 RepID=UPI0014775B69|nr:testis-expressed protein 36 [Esox lucius]